MAIDFGSSTILLVGVALLAAGLWLYRAALPKPIPGIPYKEASAKSIFGDFTEGLQYHAEHNELVAFLAQRCIELNSPICQLFMRPFGKPFVILVDAQETADICSRRSREFDRSNFFGDIFVSMAPYSHVHMKTDEHWKLNRRLLADTMSPHFLNTVAAPQLYKAGEDLVALWREKMRLSEGRPVAVDRDMHRGAFDAVYAVTFGQQAGTTQQQADILSKIDKVNGIPDSMDSPAQLPQLDNHPALDSITDLSQSGEIPINSPFPRISHRLALSWMPKYAKAMKVSTQLTVRNLDLAWEKLSQGGVKDGDEVECAADLIIGKEISLAEKEGRVPNHLTPVFRDELMIFLLAGHETSSTTLSWGLKYLTDHQDVQSKLRASLREGMPRAAEANENPTASELVHAHLPYLEAVLDETLRLGLTATGVIRTAVVDAPVLGHVIPAGTDIFMLRNGPSYISPSIPVKNSLRSESSRRNKDMLGSWDEADIGSFKPERWLTTGENGRMEHNPRAGPQGGFGAGPRGCFGRKLAGLEMRILMALLIWNFELLPTPPELSSHRALESIVRRPEQVYVRLGEVQ